MYAKSAFRESSCGKKISEWELIDSFSKTDITIRPSIKKLLPSSGSHFRSFVLASIVFITSPTSWLSHQKRSRALCPRTYWRTRPWSKSSASSQEIRELGLAVCYRHTEGDTEVFSIEALDPRLFTANTERFQRQIAFYGKQYQCQ